MKRISLVITFCCLTAAMAAGQVQMHAVVTHANRFVTIDDTANCTTGGINCWSSYSGGNFTQVIASGYSSSTIATDSNGCISIYSDPVQKGNNTWSPQPELGCGFSYVQYGGNDSLFALGGTCGSGHYLYELGGSGWASLGGCYTVFSADRASHSGVMEVIDTSGALWESTNNGSSFTKTGLCSGNGGALSVAVLEVDDLGVVCGDHSIWEAAPDGTSSSSLPGAALQITGGPGKLFVTGTDGTVYRWLLTVNTNWDHYVSSASTFLNYDPTTLSLWAVAGKPLRLSEWAVQGIHTYTSTTSCTGPCPGSPIFHDAKAQAKFMKGSTVLATGNLADSGHFLPSNLGTATSTAELRGDGIFECFNAANCSFLDSYDETTCSQEGMIDDSSGGSIPAMPGVAVDIQAYFSTLSGIFPQDNDTGGGTGYWDTDVHISSQDACAFYSPGTIPSCGGPNVIDNAAQCFYKDGEHDAECQAVITALYYAYKAGRPSPWVFYIPYIQSSSGDISCWPGSVKGVPRWGVVLNMPPCM